MIEPPFVFLEGRRAARAREEYQRRRRDGSWSVPERGTFAAQLGSREPATTDKRAASMSSFRPFAFATLALAMPGAYAHHSPAAYDMATDITIEGTVADF